MPYHVIENPMDQCHIYIIIKFPKVIPKKFKSPGKIGNNMRADSILHLLSSVPKLPQATIATVSSKEMYAIINWITMWVSNRWINWCCLGDFLGTIPNGKICSVGTGSSGNESATLPSLISFSNFCSNRMQAPGQPVSPYALKKVLNLSLKPDFKKITSPSVWVAIQKDTQGINLYWNVCLSQRHLQ